MRTLLAAVVARPPGRGARAGAPAPGRGAQGHGEQRRGQAHVADRSSGETRYEVRPPGDRRVRLKPTAGLHRPQGEGAHAYRYSVRPCRCKRCAKARTVRFALAARAKRRAPPEPTAPARRGDAFAGSPVIGGCPIFPKDNAWNTDVSRAPGRHLARLHRLARVDGAVARLRRRRRVRHPVRQRAVQAAARADHASRSPTSPIPARTRSRSTRRSRAAATATCSRCARATASCSSSTPPSARAPAGAPTAARPGTCGRTRCARSAGRRPTPPGCRSCPASPAATRPTRRDPPRAAHHRPDHPEGLHPPGDALGVLQHRSRPAADGPAPAPEGELRHHRPARPGARSSRRR